ncbi:MAG: nuclear transport factor 2 family protein [Caulobacterales bacterium]|nr:nuclear transport factor 2 family protein [Caulobacterales bacterium]
MVLRALAFSLCLAGAAVAASTPASPVQAASPAATPLAVVEQFHTAMKRGDAAAVAALMADDAVIYEQGWVEVSKDEYVTGHLPGDIAYSVGMTDQVISRRISTSGSFAVVMTQSRTTGTHEGKPVDRGTTETMVLKRTKGVWLIAHIHWSSHATKA